MAVLDCTPKCYWVLGVSGSGKSSLFQSLTSADLNDIDPIVLLPQDPDDALSPCLSGYDVSQMFENIDLSEWLIALNDSRVAASLTDPYTSVALLSRGERQRLLFTIVLAFLQRHLTKPNRRSSLVMLDECTSAQDEGRTLLMIEMIQKHLRVHAPLRVLIASQDPVYMARGIQRQTVLDGILWLDSEGARLTQVNRSLDLSWPIENRKSDLFCQAIDQLTRDRNDQTPLELFEHQTDPVIPKKNIRQILVLPPSLSMGEQTLKISAKQGTVSPGELIILFGASGMGKTRLIRSIVDNQPMGCMIGYIPQDPGRAFPEEMSVYEALGVSIYEQGTDRVTACFGDDFSEGMWHQTVKTLSEGQRQRLLLTREMLRLGNLSRSSSVLKLLLLDEPFASVDPATHVRLLTMLIGWLKAALETRSAILVSHSPKADFSLAIGQGITVKRWKIE